MRFWPAKTREDPQVMAENLKLKAEIAKLRVELSELRSVLTYIVDTSEEALRRGAEEVSSGD